MKPFRIAICIVLAFGVFAHGVVEPWSEAIFEIAAALLLLSWGLLFAMGRVARIRLQPLFWPVLALWLWAILQYLTGTTAVRFSTKVEILRLSALVFLLFVAIQAFETTQHWHAFTWALLALGFAVSTFGIVQHFTFNGKLYWIRELPAGGIPFGPYVNRNHFAGLIEMIIPAGLSLVFFRAGDRDQRPLLLILTLVPIGALFLSASRGGIASVCLATGIVLLLATMRGHARTQLVTAATIALLAGGFVIWLGAGQALGRFESYRKFEVSEARRAEMVRDSWRIFLDHPVTGTGLGTLKDVFPHYETLYDGAIVVHTHNDYVEMLAETGAIGGAICLWFLVVFLVMAWRCVRHARRSLDLALHVGAIGACCALLAHSLVDFNLHIPANAFVFLLQALLATSVTVRDRGYPPATHAKQSSKLTVGRAVQTV